jgi:subtilisin family serine protease
MEGHKADGGPSDHSSLQFDQFFGLRRQQSIRDSMKTGTYFIFLVLFAATASFAADSDVPDGVTSVTETGQIIRRTLTPNGEVTERLPYAEHDILVRFKPTASLSTRLAAHRRLGATRIKSFRHVSNLELLRVPQGLSVPQAIHAYQQHPDVLYAEPNYLVEKLGVPNDMFFSSQWNLRNTGQNGGTPGADINAVDAWDITTGSSDVVIAVIDTGVDYNHVDLAANMWRNESDCNSDGVDQDGNGYIDDCYGIDTFNHDSDPVDDNDHGTHVAGIIGAAGNNGMGVVGVNWNVKIMPCKFIGGDGFGDTAGAIACLEYVKTMKERGVNIVASNNSWGAYGFSQGLFDAISAQLDAGILFIAAAGNALYNSDILPFYPASYYLPNVISVAATSPSDQLTNFSNYGMATVHLGAPGQDILSTTRNNTLSSFSGTSMAAPHVTGLAALLKAQNPARDWKAIRNLILAGGETTASMAALTISGKRADARNALTCSNSVVSARVWPRSTRVISGLAPVDLAALNINCANPNGNVTVTVAPGNKTVILKDDGAAPDQVAGDGVYSGLWTPPSGGTFTLTFPDGDVIFVDVDPQLKPGFPVKAIHLPGTAQGGFAIHTLVGNIDSDPDLEIVVSALASGPLYAWKADGSPVHGWPVEDIVGVGYAAMGELSPKSPGLEVFSGHYSQGAPMFAYNGAGEILPGWPLVKGNYISMPPAIGDVDGDGIDEIFLNKNDTVLSGYKADGSVLPGWPVRPSPGSQVGWLPALADLDGDGKLDILYTVEGCVFAWHADGTLLPGFPSCPQVAMSVVGDVDGDGVPEIISWGYVGLDRSIFVIGANGVLKRTMKAVGAVGSSTVPALADLDGDGIPEIIYQTAGALNVWKGDGTPFPGWPVVWSTAPGHFNSSPVVGDVDGDGLPDIVVTAPNEVRAYHSNGSLIAGFPKSLPIGYGGVPAIADIDGDGRNEIIITSDTWNGIAGEYEKVWVLDLGGPPSGPVLWGQLMGGPKHQGFYAPNTIQRFRLFVDKTGTGSGTVTSSLAGIDCGADCTEEYVPGTVVTLTATPSADSVFVGWTGACSGTAACLVEMRNNRAVTATFTPLIFIATGSPNGGELWKIGSSHAVNWTSKGISGNVNVQLSRTGGTTWTTIIKNTSNDGSQNWKVAKPATTQARIRVCSVKSPSTCGMNSSNFTIQK